MILGVRIDSYKSYSNSVDLVKEIEAKIWVDVYAISTSIGTLYTLVT